MNKLSKPLIVLLFSFFLVDCSDEEFPNFNKDFPVLFNSGAVDINESGATLVSKLSLPAGEEIIEFGFTILDNTRPYDIVLHTWKDYSDFTYRLTGGLEPGEEYFYRPYAKTTNYELIGEYLPFIGQGSLEPELIEILNPSLTIGESLLVTGRNLNPLETSSMLRAGPRGGRDTELLSTLTKGDIDTLSISINVRLLTVPAENIYVVASGSELDLPGTFTLNNPEISSIGNSKGFTAETEFTVFYDNYSPLLGRTEATIYLRDANNSNAPLETVERTGLSENSMTFRSSLEGTAGSKIIIVRFIAGFELQAGPISLSDRWETVSQYPGSNQAVMSTIIDGDLFVINSQALSRYNLSNNTWTNEASFPGSTSIFQRFHFGLNNKIYAGSGNSDRRFYSFDATTGDWTQLTDYFYPGNHLRAQGNVNGNRSIVLLNGASSTITNYNPTIDQWSEFSINPPAEYGNPTGPVPHINYNDAIYFMPTVSAQGEMKIVQVVGTGSNATFREISSQVDENMIDRLDNSFFGNGMIMGDMAVFTISYRVNQVGRATWTYNFTTGEWTEISSKITKDITTSFTYQDELYGIVWNPSIPSHRQLMRFKAEPD